MSFQGLTRRAVRALVLLLSLLGAGCGGGSPSPMPPTGPGPPPPGGGGLPQPIGTMTRGPFLQHADNGVTVAWYTEAPTEGRVRWFLDDDTTGEAVSSAGTATRHEAVISSLRPGARYAYRVYTARGLLAENSTSLYLSTLKLSKHMKMLLGASVKLEYFRPFTWYRRELTASGIQLDHYNSFNLLVLEGMPRSIVHFLQRLELRHYKRFPLKLGLLRRLGADLKLRALVR